MFYKRDFLVFPQHCNHRGVLIFGGAFLAELDLTAAFTTKNFLDSYDSPFEAVTHKFGETTFRKPTYVGDLLTLVGEVTEAKGKHICLSLKAYRKEKLIAETTCVFITIISGTSLEDKPEFLPYTNHDIVFPSVK